MIKNLLKRLLPQVAPLAELVQPMTRKCAPGERVHHEYFISGDAPTVSWLARVYGKNGEINEERGTAISESLARENALAWCTPILVALRGE